FAGTCLAGLALGRADLAGTDFAGFFAGSLVATFTGFFAGGLALAGAGSLPAGLVTFADLAATGAGAGFCIALGTAGVFAGGLAACTAFGADPSFAAEAATRGLGF